MRPARISTWETEFSARLGLEHLLLDDLRELLWEPFDSENRRWTAAVVSCLLKVVAAEQRLQASDGYLSDVLDEFPWWIAQVERLEQNHQKLIRQLRRAQQRLRLPPRRDADRGIRRELWSWLECFTRHRQRERELVQLSVNLDLGGEG